MYKFTHVRKPPIPALNAARPRGITARCAGVRRGRDRQVFELHNFFNKYRSSDPLGTVSAFIVTVEGQRSSAAQDLRRGVCHSTMKTKEKFDGETASSHSIGIT